MREISLFGDRVVSQKKILKANLSLVFPKHPGIDCKECRPSRIGTTRPAQSRSTPTRSHRRRTRPGDQASPLLLEQPAKPVDFTRRASDGRPSHASVRLRADSRALAASLRGVGPHQVRADLTGGPPRSPPDRCGC